MKSVDHNTVQFSLSHIKEAVLWTDLAGNILYHNPTSKSNVGYDLTASSIFKVAPTINRLQWNQWMHQLNRKKVFSVTTQHRHRFGHSMPVQWEMSLCTLAEEPVVFITAKNIGDNQRMQSLFQFAEEIVRIGAWEWNIATKELYHSDEIPRLLGMDEQMTINIELGMQLCSTSSKIKLEKAFREAIATGIPFDENIDIVDAQGEEKYLNVSVMPQIADGEVRKLIGVVQDISRKKEVAKQLRMKEFMLESVSDMVFWINNEGKFIFVNDAVAVAHQSTKKELLGKHVWDVAPLVEAELWEERWEWFRKEKHVSYESIHSRKDGSHFPVNVSVNFLQFEEKEYIAAILRDITESKQKEAELKAVIEKLDKLKERLQAENEYLYEDIRIYYNFDEIITVSPKYQETLRELQKVAPTDTTVLILGETGTGKELLARAVHSLSNRSKKSLVKINCANLPANLMESELFGHEKGAFTGADRRKIGRFELADGGTIFLDEIGELPLELQAKLLRVLQGGEFSRLGSNETLNVDVRVVAATNRDLLALSQEGKFRQDLYYRLNVFPVNNLPLRERKEDVPSLTTHFMKKFSEKIGRSVTKISKKAMDKLMKYNYPGNIRELENIIERAVILSRATKLNLDFWEPDYQVMLPDEFVSLREMQKEYIIKVLKHCNWQVSGKGGAAECLQMNPKTLDSKMKRLGIDRRDFMVR
ncbi:MAG: sigma 54-interacting transcriptional regulator [Bacteroidota bacterium]